MNSCGLLNKSESEFQSIIRKRNHQLYEKYIPEKFANSGVDPIKQIIEFANKDLIKPIKKPNIFSQEIDQKKLNSTTWAVGTTKTCTDIKNLPKKQDYKTYNFVKINEQDKEKYKKIFNKNDNVSIKFPIENANKTSSSFIDVKSKLKFINLSNNFLFLQKNFA
jgi:hypothetical protein